NIDAKDIYVCEENVECQENAECQDNVECEDNVEWEDNVDDQFESEKNDEEYEFVFEPNIDCNDEEYELDTQPIIDYQNEDDDLMDDFNDGTIPGQIMYDFIKIAEIQEWRKRTDKGFLSAKQKFKKIKDIEFL
ncbi:hypothetical protein SNEBB_001109, partial [Seison nebaliae]